MIPDVIIIGEGIFKLDIEVNKREIITQNDALADFLARQVTQRRKTISAIIPILKMAQKQIHKYRNINTIYSIFLFINLYITQLLDTYMQF